MMEADGGDAAETSKNEGGNTPPSSREAPVERAPVRALFRFASAGDVALLLLAFVFSILCSGTMPGMCIAFGDLIDAMAVQTSVKEILRDVVIFMVALGVYGLTTFFLAFFFFRAGPPGVWRTRGAWRISRPSFVRTRPSSTWRRRARSR